MSAIALLLVTSTASAQAIFYDFDDDDDDDWTQINPVGNATYTFESHRYRIQAPVPPHPEETGPARAGSILENTIFSDFRVTVDLVDWDNDAETRQAIGIVARVNLGEHESTSNGYFFHYDPYGTGGNAGLWIDGIAEEMPFGIEGGFIQITRLNPTEDYVLEFIGIGNELTGRIYSTGGSLLHTLTVTDSTYASGYVGLLVADQGAGSSADATFDNFSAIPEPGTYALIAGMVGGAAAVYVRRRRVR